MAGKAGGRSERSRQRAAERAKNSSKGGSKGGSSNSGTGHATLSGVTVTGEYNAGNGDKAKKQQPKQNPPNRLVIPELTITGNAPEDITKTYLVHNPLGTDEIYFSVIEITASADDDEETYGDYGWGVDRSESGGDSYDTAKSNANRDVNPNVMEYGDNPALQMVYNPKTGEYTLNNAATGEAVAGMRLNDNEEYEAFGAWEQIEKGNPESLAVDETFNFYEKNPDGTLNFNKVVKSMTTRKGIEKGYDYTTTTTEDTFYGKYEEQAHYNPGEQKINRIDRKRDTFIGSILTDFHTLNINEQAYEVGMTAEAFTDLLEAVGDPADTEALADTARTVDMVATVASVIMSVYNIVQMAPYLANPQAALAALKNLANVAQGISDVNSLAGKSPASSRTGFAKTINKALNNLYSTDFNSHYFNGDGDAKRVIKEGLAGAFMSSPMYGEYNFYNSGYLSPVQNYGINNRFGQKQPQIEKGDNNMQQSIMPTSLIGMNNVKESHLLSADEAQFLENATTLSGSIESTSNHDYFWSLGLTYDACYEYDDDGYRGRMNYFQRDNVSFANIANQTYCLKNGRLYKVNTKRSGMFILENNIELPVIDAGNVFIKIKNNIADSLMQQVLNMIQKIKVVAPVEKVNESKPKDGDTPKYKEIAAAITTPNYDAGMRAHLEDGKRFYHLEGTTEANNGERIAVVVGGSTITTVATNKTWKVDVDLLDAFGSILNVNNQGTDEIYYAVTAYDKATGMESLPVKSNSCFNFSKLINLYVENPNEKYSLKIYRKDVSSSMYKFISLQSYKGNNVFVDNLADIPSPQYLDFTEIKEVTGLRGLVEHKATLFAYKGSYVYFSKPGRPNIWNELQCVTVNEQITGLASSPLGLMIFTAHSTYLLGGTDRVNYTISNLSKSIGCSHPTSIANIKNAVIWVFDGDVMLSVGSTINNLTKGRYKFKDSGKLEIINAITVGDIYYIFSKEKVTKMDFSLNHPIITEMDIGNAFGASVNDELYFVKDYVLYKAYQASGYSKLTATTVKFVGGSMDLTKEFNSVNIVYKGDFTISVYIDDMIVAKGDFSSNKQEVANIGIPVDYNEGLGIHLKFEGKGKIYSYRYIFDNRNLR